MPTVRSLAVSIVPVSQAFLSKHFSTSLAVLATILLPTLVRSCWSWPQLTDLTVARQNHEEVFPSKLRMLVPTAGPFFTRLPLEAAFKYQDRKRNISFRRYVAPSFNDVRLILNSAQVMAVTNGALQLATFDGDVTLYDDGQSLEPSSPVVPRLLGISPPL